MEKVKVAVIGAGNRGTYAYAPYIYENSDVCEIVAVAEPKKGRRELFTQKYNLDSKNVFETLEDFFKHDKMADAVIIATNDDRHYDVAKLALEKGYHVLLEKPLSNSLDGLVHIDDLCDKYKDKIFMICHVLRYSPFYNKLKEIVESKKLGELVSIQYNENIGYWHFAHSFTRGNWRNSNETSPLILAKSCHDMDILLYLVGSRCKKISAFGSLKHLNNQNASGEMAQNCLQCLVEKKCPYSAKRIYLEKDRSINRAVHINPTEENLLNILKTSPYGRCVYRCDNNVVDNMVNILQFENGVTATFNLCAFTKENGRTIKLMFSHGEVGGDLNKNEIRIKEFGKNEEIVMNPSNQQNMVEEYDRNLIAEFIKLVSNKELEKGRVAAKEAIQSHVMAFAAEYSRVSDEVVYIEEFFDSAKQMTKEIEETIF